MNTQLITNKLKEGLKEKIFPDYNLLVASQGNILWQSSSCDSNILFDIASLTKPLCTALLTMILHQQKKIALTDCVTDFFETEILKAVTIEQLLNHTSGLVDWIDFFSRHEKEKPETAKQKILFEILNDPALKKNHNNTVYSDLGYILLGFILEKTTNQSLNTLFFDLIAKPLGIEDAIFFIPLPDKIKRDQNKYLPTEKCSHRNKIIQAEVMDNNAQAMGGVCGHAGLFATISATEKILEELRKASFDKSKLITQKTFQSFCIPDQHRNLEKRYFTSGFDTPTKGVSQSGTLFSPLTIGHIGFTGVNFWWDLKQDFWIIFFTNRTMPDRTNQKIRQFRPTLHNMIIQEWGLNF